MWLNIKLIEKKFFFGYFRNIISEQKFCYYETKHLNKYLMLNSMNWNHKANNNFKIRIIFLFYMRGKVKDSACSSLYGS